MSDLKQRSRRDLQQKEFHKSFTRNDHLSDQSLWSRINWLNCTIVFGVPVLAIYGVCTQRTFIWQTWLLALFFYFFAGLGITAGYHRLWSHRSFTASFPLQLFLMFAGCGAVQGSIKWWSLLHRAHHRWTDTDSDPYNSRRGFWYAHVGWLLLDSIRIDAHVDISDLRANAIVRWQHTHYSWLAPFAALILPTLIAAYFWGDPRGGFFIAGALRLLLNHHATWCVNSVAHYIGRASFDDTISPRDSIITGLLTFGEGYHNFHHEFPNDYRNGVKWVDYDPTKWFVRVMSVLGLASELRRFPSNEIRKGELDMFEKELARRKLSVDYGVAIDSLPKWTRSQFETYSKKGRGRILVAEQGVVYDVTAFVREGRHPGGKAVIVGRNGKDVTKEFNGAVYNHTNAARNLMAQWRVATLVR